MHLLLGVVSDQALDLVDVLTEVGSQAAGVKAKGDIAFIGPARVHLDLDELAAVVLDVLPLLLKGAERLRT
ncbi:MAG: hypothetical protein ACWGSD_19850 [Thermodesulfobacteriota bacterium]